MEKIKLDGSKTPEGSGLEGQGIHFEELDSDNETEEEDEDEEDEEEFEDEEYDDEEDEEDDDEEEVEKDKKVEVEEHEEAVEEEETNLMPDLRVSKDGKQDVRWLPVRVSENRKRRCISSKSPEGSVIIESDGVGNNFEEEPVGEIDKDEDVEEEEGVEYGKEVEEEECDEWLEKMLRVDSDLNQNRSVRVARAEQSPQFVDRECTLDCSEETILDVSENAYEAKHRMQREEAEERNVCQTLRISTNDVRPVMFRLSSEIIKEANQKPKKSYHQLMFDNIRQYQDVRYATARKIHQIPLLPLADMIDKYRFCSKNYFPKTGNVLEEFTAVAVDYEGSVKTLKFDNSMDSRKSLERMQAMWWRKARGKSRLGNIHECGLESVKIIKDDILYDQHLLNPDEETTLSQVEMMVDKIIYYTSKNRKTDDTIPDSAYFVRKFLLMKKDISFRMKSVSEVPDCCLPPILKTGYYPHRARSKSEKEHYLMERYKEAREEYWKLTYRDTKPKDGFVESYVTAEELFSFHKIGRHIHGFFVVWKINDKRYLVDVFNFFFFPLFAPWRLWETKLKVAFDRVTVYNLHLSEILRANQPVFYCLKNSSALYQPLDPEMIYTVITENGFHWKTLFEEKGTAACYKWAHEACNYRHLSAYMLIVAGTKTPRKPSKLQYDKLLPMLYFNGKPSVTHIISNLPAGANNKTRDERKCRPFFRQSRPKAFGIRARSLDSALDARVHDNNVLKKCLSTVDFREVAEYAEKKTKKAIFEVLSRPGCSADVFAKELDANLEKDMLDVTNVFKGSRYVPTSTKLNLIESVMLSRLATNKADWKYNGLPETQNRVLEDIASKTRLRNFRGSSNLSARWFKKKQKSIISHDYYRIEQRKRRIVCDVFGKCVSLNNGPFSKQILLVSAYTSVFEYHATRLEHMINAAIKVLFNPFSLCHDNIREEIHTFIKKLELVPKKLFNLETAQRQLHELKNSRKQVSRREYEKTHRSLAKRVIELALIEDIIDSDPRVNYTSVDYVLSLFPKEVYPLESENVQFRREAAKDLVDSEDAESVSCPSLDNHSDSLGLLLNTLSNQNVLFYDTLESTMSKSGLDWTMKLFYNHQSAGHLYDLIVHKPVLTAENMKIAPRVFSAFALNEMISHPELEKNIADRKRDLIELYSTLGNAPSPVNVAKLPWSTTLFCCNNSLLSIRVVTYPDHKNQNLLREKILPPPSKKCRITDPIR